MDFSLGVPVLFPGILLDIQPAYKVCITCQDLSSLIVNRRQFPTKMSAEPVCLRALFISLQVFFVVVIIARYNSVFFYIVNKLLGYKDNLYFLLSEKANRYQLLHYAPVWLKASSHTLPPETSLSQAGVPRLYLGYSCEHACPSPFGPLTLLPIIQACSSPVWYSYPANCSLRPRASLTSSTHLRAHTVLSLACRLVWTFTGELV